MRNKLNAIKDEIFIDLNDQPIKNINKNKIISIAIKQFSIKGYSSVSIREITNEVGIKESALYNHFKSKEELLETIFHNFQIETGKIMPSVKDLDYLLTVMSPKEFFAKGLTNFLEHISNPLMERIWCIILLERYRNPLAREIYLQDVLENTLVFLEAVFNKLIALHQIKDIAPRTLAEEYQLPIFTMVELYIIMRIDGRDTSNFETRIKQHLDFFIHQISN
jgi:AcrR family transcriptional regulator